MLLEELWQLWADRKLALLHGEPGEGAAGSREDGSNLVLRLLAAHLSRRFGSSWP